MTCEEAFRRLLDALNSGSENSAPEVVEEHIRLCETCCEYCRFNDEVISAIQSGVLKKATPDLRSRIVNLLNLPDCT